MTEWISQAWAQQAKSMGGHGLQARTSLAQAVRIAERQTGGRAWKAEMERARGAYVYEIETASQDGATEVVVDPASGNVLRVDTPGFESSVASIFGSDGQRKDRVAWLEASSMGLAGAIDAAAKEPGGGVVGAALKSRQGSTLFEVSVIKDSVLRKVWVNPTAVNVVMVAPHGERTDEDD